MCYMLKESQFRRPICYLLHLPIFSAVNENKSRGYCVFYNNGIFVCQFFFKSFELRAAFLGVF